MTQETVLEVVPTLIGAYGGHSCRIRYPNGDQVSCVVSLFACEVVAGIPRADGDESLEVRFVSEDELAGLDISTIGRALLDARQSAC